MDRTRPLVWLAIALGATACAGEQVELLSPIRTLGATEAALPGPTPMACPHCSAGPGGCTCGDAVFGPAITAPRHADRQYKHWLIDQLMFRHRRTHGRAMGPGDPLRGTSWLNRPFSVGVDVGALFLTSSPSTNVRANNDVMAAFNLGYDWDHYWGSQLRVVWSTPDLVNDVQPDSPTGDNFFIADLSALYYPWGDSRTRPYYRIGVGVTDIEYTRDSGLRRQDTLFTVPLAIGVKHQMRRWLAWRVELADNIAIGDNGTSSLQNITVSAGLEWRFGVPERESRGWAGRGRGW